MLKVEPELSQGLAQEIMKRSGQNLVACYQCRRCAAGCPVGEETGVTPDQLIRLIVLGDKEGAVNNLLVWKCLACYTCGRRCPNNIQTARITETLKQIAKETHSEPLIPDVAAFHHAFMSASSHFGRINEIELMGIYQTEKAVRDIKRGNLKSFFDEAMAQAKLGIGMLKRKRLHFSLSFVKGLGEVRRLFKRARRNNAGSN